MCGLKLAVDGRPQDARAGEAILTLQQRLWTWLLRNCARIRGCSPRPNAAFAKSSPRGWHSL